MSKAMELLNNLDELVQPDEGYILIDGSRKIIVPDSLKRIAVQHDHNVETVTFVCPRKWDGVDMSDKDIYINYLRADGIPGSFKAVNVTAEEGSETMSFGWTILKHLTQVKGSIVFSVCITGKDENGDETFHWNSERNSEMYISEGLEIDEAIVEKYPNEIAVLTSVTEEDNGKFMRVVGGEWAAVAIPNAEEASF